MKTIVALFLILCSSFVVGCEAPAPLEPGATMCEEYTAATFYCATGVALCTTYRVGPQVPAVGCTTVDGVVCVAECPEAR